MDDPLGIVAAAMAELQLTGDERAALADLVIDGLPVRPGHEADLDRLRRRVREMAAGLALTFDPVLGMALEARPGEAAATLAALARGTAWHGSVDLGGLVSSLLDSRRHHA